MYGTIFTLNIKPGHHDALIKDLAEQSPPTGMIAWFVMNPDKQESWIGVAIFEDRETYVANAESPQQHESFLKMMGHLESEPTWTDGTYVGAVIA